MNYLWNLARASISKLRTHANCLIEAADIEKTAKKEREEAAKIVKAEKAAKVRGGRPIFDSPILRVLNPAAKQSVKD